MTPKERVEVEYVLNGWGENLIVGRVVRRLLGALETISNWSVPLEDPDPEDPQTEYGQIKRFARSFIPAHPVPGGESR